MRDPVTQRGLNPVPAPGEATTPLAGDERPLIELAEAGVWRPIAVLSNVNERRVLVVEGGSPDAAGVQRVLKLYSRRDIPEGELPNQQVLARLADLRHPNLLGLHRHGVVIQGEDFYFDLWDRAGPSLLDGAESAEEFRRRFTHRWLREVCVPQATRRAHGAPRRGDHPL